MKDHLLVYNYLSYYTARTKHVVRGWFGKGGDAQSLAAAPGESNLQHLLALREAYRWIQHLCEQHDVELLIVAAGESDELTQVCSELSLPLVQLNDYFRRAGFDSPHSVDVSLGKDPYHWNERGNRIVAEALHAELQRISLAERSTNSRRTL